MKCPACDSKSTRRVWTKSRTDTEGDAYMKRRRECADCGHRFTTFECYELADVEAAFRLRDAEILMRKLRITLFGKQDRTSRAAP